MVSVAMATYNGEKYIRKQLESILNQLAPTDEIIISDDCSSDKTLEIVCDIMNNHPIGKIIKIVENESNQGYIRNFRKAISLTKGNYIFLADQDDIWESSKVRELVKYMDTQKAVLVCTASKLIDSNDKEIKDISQYVMHPIVRRTKEGNTSHLSFFKMLFGNVAQGCTYCFVNEVKELFLKINNDITPHDYQLVLCACLIGDVYYWNNFLIQYRIHESNTIGFEMEENHSLELRKPKRTPDMVVYLNQLKTYIKIRNVWFYKLLFYLRIPYFYSLIRK